MVRYGGIINIEGQDRFCSGEFTLGEDAHTCNQETISQFRSIRVPGSWAPSVYTIRRSSVFSACDGFLLPKFDNNYLNNYNKKRAELHDF